MREKEQGFCLESPGGMRVLLSAVGAAVREVYTADRYGEFANIALTPAKTIDDSFAGTTLAPYVGRVRNGCLWMDGQRFQLSQNEGNNHLHGGFENLSKQRWQTQGILQEESAQSICFVATARDGCDGYPGNRTFAVIYRLLADHRLDIHLQAESDRATCFNLSNHLYWNLTGDFTAPPHQLLCVGASEVYFNDVEHLAQELISVAQTPFDFHMPTDVTGRLSEYAQHPQLRHARGYNHAFVLSESPAATLYDPVSGRKLTLATDAPTLVVYSGGYLDTTLASGLHVGASCAVALEPQSCPLLHAGEGGSVTHVGETYARSISYRFDIVT